MFKPKDLQIFVPNYTNMSTFHAFEVVGHSTE